MYGTYSSVGIVVFTTATMSLATVLGLSLFLVYILT